MTFQPYITAYDLPLNLFLCAIDMCILTELMQRMYGPVQHFKKAVICTATLLVLALMLLPSSYENSFFTVPASFLLLGFYPKNGRKKLLFSCCLFTVCNSYLLILNDITNLLPRGRVWVMWYLIGYHMGLWAVLFLCLRLCRETDTDLPRSLWCSFLLIPVLTLGCSFILVLVFESSPLSQPSLSILHIILQSTFFVINVLVFDLFRRFCIYAADQREKDLLEQQVEYQQSYYRGLSQAAEQTRQIRHDLKNHLQTISLLYEGGKQNELAEYLRDTWDALRQTEQFVMTGNPSLDALLNLKLGEIKRSGIRCTPEIAIPRELGLPFSDTVTLVGNLLDNAIHSCRKISGDPAIRLQISYQEGTLLLCMENPCTEPEAAPYGIGMKNVEKIVRKYDGILRTECGGGVYCTNTVLYGLHEKADCRK